MARLLLVVAFVVFVITPVIESVSDDSDLSFGPVSFKTRPVLNEPIPLTKDQITSIQTAVQSGLVDQVCTLLRSNGTVQRNFQPRPGDRFAAAYQPIITPTPEQQRIIDECYTPVPATPVTKGGRMKRNAPGLNLDVACRGDVSTILFAVTGNGEPAQVMTRDIPSATSCTKTITYSACDGTCCKDTFEIFALIIILSPGTHSMVFRLIEVEHCTCLLL